MTDPGPPDSTYPAHVEGLPKRQRLQLDGVTNPSQNARTVGGIRAGGRPASALP